MEKTVTHRPDESRAKEVMSIEEMADYLGIRRGLATQLIKSGDIPHTRVGEKLIRVLLADVRAYLEQRRVEG